jgi:hypothetical protein
MKIESMSIDELKTSCTKLNLSITKIIQGKAKIKVKTKEKLAICLEEKNIEFDKTANKQLIQSICEENGCEITETILGKKMEKQKTKAELIETLNEHLINEIKVAKANNNGHQFIKDKIVEISNEYSEKLKEKIDSRTEEMKSDDNSHYLIYNILGLSNEDGQKIDLYQNTGRFLYKYAGAFLEEIAVLCFRFNDPNSERILVKNTIDSSPKTFEIDCLSGNNAYEIKWRDATTDGDHVKKEHKRIKVIKEHGYTPIRVMFYYPNRKQAKTLQELLKDLYLSARINGEYYAGDDAWDYVKNTTTIDLKKILIEIVKERADNDE